MVKLADNLWIDLNIALANELAKLVDALPFPIDVMEVIRGANTLKKGQHHVNILYPANGVGGYCLTKDPWFVDALGRRAGVELADPEDRARGQRLDARPRLRPGDGGARRARHRAPATPGSRSSASPSRATPATPASPPWRRSSRSSAPPAAACGSATRWSPPPRPATTASTLEPDWQTAVAGADAVLILAGHDAFAAITPGDFARLAPGALIYDGRIYYPRARIAELEAAGLGLHGRRPLAPAAPGQIDEGRERMAKSARGGNGDRRGRLRGELPRRAAARARPCGARPRHRAARRGEEPRGGQGPSRASTTSQGDIRDRATHRGLLPPRGRASSTTSPRWSACGATWRTRSASSTSPSSAPAT